MPEVAEQMGPAPAMTIGTYTHVIGELKGEPVVPAEVQIERAREERAGRPGAVEAESAEESVVSEYAARLGAVDAMRMLQARGLACDGQLTVAGTLLFAELPQRFMPEAFMRVVRSRGTERGAGAHQQVTRDVRIEGPIPRQIPNTRVDAR